MLWDLDQAADIMKWYGEFIVQAPEEINGFFAFLTVPPGPPFPEPLHFKKCARSSGAYNGAAEQANDLLQPLRTSAIRLSSLLGSLPPQHCKACLMAFIHPGCNGIGKRTL